jgi:hypothetical protein
MSSSMMFPNPWQVGHAPNGLLRDLVRDTAGAALEPLAESMRRLRRARVVHFDGERRAVALVKRRLNRIGEPGSHVGTDLQAIHDHRNRRPLAKPIRIRRRLLERQRAAVEQEAPEAPAPERIEGAEHGIVRKWQGVAVGRRRVVVRVGLALGRVGREADADNRIVEPDEQPRPRGQPEQLAGHGVRRLALHFTAAAPADGASHTGPQQPQVIVDFRGRPDRRARIPDAVLLPDRDRRRDAIDAVDVGLLHPLEELAGIRRQRFHVSPLALGVDRVEGERRLARSADAGDDDELAM